MKTINLQNAFEFLVQSPAIILEGRALEPELYDLNGEPDNVFFRLFWHDKGLDFEVLFEEGDNENVEVNGQFLTLINNEGVSEEIELLAEFDAESYLAY
jgi:hypothetical protein